MGYNGGISALSEAPKATGPYGPHGGRGRRLLGVQVRASLKKCSWGDGRRLVPPGGAGLTQRALGTGS